MRRYGVLTERCFITFDVVAMSDARVSLERSKTEDNMRGHSLNEVGTNVKL